jgi:voltage-gated potassium channel
MIILSLIPLAFKEDIPVFVIIDKVAASAFILDYLLRLITAPYKYTDMHPARAVIRYPFTFMAVVDLVSILPSLTVLNKGFKVLRILRMIRALRVLRIFKAMRYSKSMKIIADVLRTSRSSLAAVGSLALVYIMISALIIFNVEPDSFNNFFDAIYWATVSLTTVGYGDIYPTSTLGRIVAMLSSIFGIAIVALPAGIITAGYMDTLNNK